MKKSLRRLIALLLFTLFLGGSLCTLQLYTQRLTARQTYRQAQEQAQVSQPPVRVVLPDLAPPLEPQPGPPEQAPPAESGPPVPEQPLWQEAPVHGDPLMESLLQTDLAALREQNGDVRGWILIPDTQLNYPVMQGEDNSYYLNNTWLGQPSSAGSVFLECQNSSDFSDFNTILYGHRMIDGSMFATLKYYKDQAYWQEHPYVYLVDDLGVHRYEIFAAYEAGVTTSTYYLAFTDQRRQEFIDSALERSVIDTAVTPSINDRILTLSTCTGKGYDTRWVVQARLQAA